MFEQACDENRFGGLGKSSSKFTVDDDEESRERFVSTYGGQGGK